MIGKDRIKRRKREGNSSLLSIFSFPTPILGMDRLHLAESKTLRVR